jgi:catechol 2,3-dioxygenase-like lactoylglutathione lyase family enzyme
MLVKSICGTILISTDPEALARFYAEALGLPLEREDHGGLAPHWGADIGTVHFGIHPPENFKVTVSGRGRVALTFDVSSLAECQSRLARLGAECLLPPHDEGFGVVAAFRDPDGNPFEVVELRYQFAPESGTAG